MTNGHQFTESGYTRILGLIIFLEVQLDDCTSADDTVTGDDDDDDGDGDNDLHGLIQ